MVAYDLDPIGLYLDPYSSLINHSCDYNAIVVFDGDKMTVKTTQPIAKDEQVFISYIDTTYSVTTRRKQLAERYFFDCQCPRCTRELMDSGEENIATIEAAERAGQALIDRVSNLQGDAKIERLKTETSQILKSMPLSTDPVYARQPLPALRNELILALVDAGQYADAWLQSAIEFLKIDPVLYPARGHPLRRVHALRLARLTAAESPSLASKFNIRPDVVLLRVMQWLIDGEREACSAPLLQANVRDQYRVCAEWVSRERIQGNTIQAAWQVVEELVEDALRRDVLIS